MIKVIDKQATKKIYLQNVQNQHRAKNTKKGNQERHKTDSQKHYALTYTEKVH